MRLRTLTVSNFRQFYGTQTIRFATEADKNVTVLYGANGSGKTTLLNAFTWCLFKKFTPAFENQDHLINERALHEAQPLDEVIASVRLEFEHEGKTYNITRESSTKKTRDGGLQLGRDAEAKMWHTDETGRQSATNKMPEDAINQIIPERLHRFFFFDGERIEHLVKPSAYEEIGIAIKTVLGLTIIERAIKHLFSVGKKLEGELRDVAPPDMQLILDDLESLSRQIAEKTSSIATESGRRANLKIEIEAVNARLRALDKEKEMQERRDILEEEFEAGRTRIQAIRTELSHKFSLDGHLAFSGNLCDIAIAKLDKLRERGALPTPLKRQFVEDLLESAICICGSTLEFGSERYRSVAEWKEKAGNAEVEEVWTKLSASTNDFVRNRQEFYKDLQNRHDELAAVQQAQERRMTEISAIDSAIDKRGSEEARDLGQKRKAHELANEDSIGRSSILTKDLADLQERHRTKAKEQQAKELEGQLAQLAQRRLGVVQETRNVFDQILQIRTEEVRQKLDTRLKSIYRKISFKRYTPQLTEDFRLDLVKTVGSVDGAVAKGQGENQILSLAFVGAIADLARERYQEATAKEGGLASFQGGIYPIVMDSPFGSLDVGYQTEVAKAIPELAPQVVVFVSKSQGLGAVQAELAPRVGERYVISYWTPKSDVSGEAIELDGRDCAYISASGNEYEWAEVMEVPIAKARN
jgi:DNA sulfur modification protein DndD